MNCEQIHERLSAWLDRELSPEESAETEFHVKHCAACGSLAQDLGRQEVQLRQAFASRRSAALAVAEKVNARIRRERPAFAAPNGRFRVPGSWPLMGFSLAAGFMLAVIAFRPWERPAFRPDQAPGDHDALRRQLDAVLAESVRLRDELDQERVELAKVKEDFAKDLAAKPAVDSAPRPVAQLIVARGTIEVLLPGRDDWKPMTTGGAIEPGSKVRTAQNGRCEFTTPDHSTIRLNGGTELTFHTNRRLELARGQVWSSVAHDKDLYQVLVPLVAATVTALGTEFDLECQGQETLLTVAQGTTRVEGQGREQLVRVGEQARIRNGLVAEKKQVQDLVVATSWIHEILKLKGRDNAELARRMNDLLSRLGENKATFMAEKEILALGDHCVLPLTRFIQSDRSRLDPRRRVYAASVLAKIAQPWSVADLIDLLQDADQDVRFYAARALERLTDGMQVLTPAQWRDASADARARALDRLKGWWTKSKERFPEPP